MNKQNYLDRKPKVKSGLYWSTNEKGEVTLEIENKKIYRRLFHLPKKSYVHLDALGSFVWLQLDGEKDVYEIGKNVEKAFGKKTEPLFERLIKYFAILESYKFIDWA